MYRTHLILVIAICCLSNLLSQDLTVVSWNLKDFGQSRDAEEMFLIAAEVRHADIVAVQEVVAKHPGGAKAVARLADVLNRTGAKWDYRVSDPTQSSSPHKSERYAFLWKTSKVTITGGRPQLIVELSDLVEREPYFIQFKTRSGDKLALLNYHACTHDNTYPEREEISYISSWLLKQSYDNVIWCGDMNLVIDDQAFSEILSSGYVSALNGQKTSLKMKCKEGNYLSRAEDNLLYNLSSMSLASGRVLDFIEDGNCEDVSWKRTSYSDHLGVEVKLGI